jgi:hypothetical protein
VDEIIFIAPPATPQTQPAYTWYMDQGDFLDRFGPTVALAILLSTDSVVQALFKNITTRKWVDLQRPDVIDAVNYIAGETVAGLGTISTPIAGMTAALASTILTTPPTPQEQLTTVKLYFS